MPLQRKSKWQQRPRKIKEKGVSEDRAEFWQNLMFGKPKQKKKQTKKKVKKNYEPTMTVRDAVKKRDHHKCQFPGCECRDINLHHIIFRSQGGKNDEANLVSLCSTHHTLSKDSPHKSAAWRRFWEGWSQERYPKYWEERIRA